MNGVRMLSLWRRITSAALAAVIFCNTNVLTFSAAGVGTLFVSKPTYAFAYNPILQQDQDELFNRLKEQYNTDDPNRNYQDTNSLLDELESQPTRPPRDLTNKLQQMLEANQDNEPLDMSEHIDEDFDMEAAQESYTNSALTVGQTHGAPTQTSTGNTKVEYAKESPIEVYRDPETGELGVRKKDNADSIPRNTSGVSDSETYSAQIDHEDTSFEAKDAHGDNEKIYATGAQTHTKLKSSSTRTGEALGYQTVTNSANAAINTEVPDSVLQPAFNSLENATSDSGSFLNGCTTTTSTETTELYSPDIVKEMCHDLNKDNLGFCEIKRKLNVPALIDGQGFVSCGPGCYEMRIGQEGDNYRGPGGDAHNICEEYVDTRSMVIKPNTNFKVKEVQVSAYLDDHIQLELNGTPAFSRINARTSKTEFFDSHSWSQCERGNDGFGGASPGNWFTQETGQYGLIDITQEVKSALQVHADGTLNIKVRNKVGGLGEMHMRIRFYFEDVTGEGSGQVFEDYPAGCAAEAGIDLPERVPFATPSSGGGSSPGGGGGDGQPPGEGPVVTQSMSASSTETLGGTTTSQSHILPSPNDVAGGASCRFDGYQTIDEGTKGFPQEYLDGIGPFYEGDEGNASWEVNLEGYRCDPFDGEEYCVNDNGEQKCFTWDELQNMEVPNSCAEYSENEQCSEISRECVSGWYDETQDICFNEEVEYECDYGDDVSFEYESTENTCDTMIPCAGGDCGPDNEEKNDRFVEAMGMASVMEHMKSDSSCTDPEDPSTCRVFEGEYEYCSWEVTGMGNNCCEAPDGVSFMDYINFSQAMMKLDNKIFDGQYLNQPVEGAWTTIKDGASSVYEYFSGEPLTSTAESVVGNLSGQVTTQSGEVISHTFGEGILGAVQQQVSQWIYDALPKALGDALFSTAGAAGSETVTGLSGPMNAAMNVFGYIMIAYMVYQLVNLAAMLLTQCDENEEDVGLKLEMRQCFETSDKYCVSEVLGICVVRQKDHCCYSSMLARIIMEQAAPMLGKDMSQCEGLTPEELGNLDFDQIDLSEWTSTMIEQDMVPGNNEESLTGSGRMDNAPSRDTATERTQERLDGASDINSEATESIKSNPLDCSVYPRPPVCSFGIDPTDNGGGG